MAPDAEGTYTARPVRCHACSTRSDAASGFEGNTGGLYWSVDRG